MRAEWKSKNKFFVFNIEKDVKLSVKWNAMCWSNNKTWIESKSMRLWRIRWQIGMRFYQNDTDYFIVDTYLDYSVDMDR